MLHLSFFSQKQRNLLATKPSVSHCGIQTDFLDSNESLEDWNVSRDVESLGIVDRVKRVAESALLQTGFVYERTSGMYYDYNTGYYYDAVRMRRMFLFYRRKERMTSSRVIIISEARFILRWKYWNIL